MADNISKASQFIKKGLYLSNLSGKRIDIKFLTNNITMVENMTDGFIHGRIGVFDGLALAYEFPLTGEEYIEFDFLDFDGNEFKHKFHVFAVDDLRPVANNNDHMMQYTLHFASMHKVYNESAYIRKVYKDGQFHQYAQSVYDGIFNETKPWIADPSDNQINIIAPGYNPIDTIHMFSRKAYSNQYKTGTFRFYETKTNFQFRNHESIQDDYKNKTKTALTFSYDMEPDSSPQGQINMRKNLISFDLGTHANSIRDLKYGSYNRQIMEIDYDNRQIITTNYKHHDEFKSYKQAEQLKDYHTEEINNLAYSPHIVMVNKNWITPYDPNTKYKLGFTQTADILARKHTNFDIFHQHKFKIKIHGNLKINPGDMINLNIPIFKATTNQRDNKNPYNGLYIIDQIQHNFINDEYYADITIGRNGLKEYK